MQNLPRTLVLNEDMGIGTECLSEPFPPGFEEELRRPEQSREQISGNLPSLQFGEEIEPEFIFDKKYLIGLDDIQKPS